MTEVVDVAIDDTPDPSVRGDEPSLTSIARRR